ncbi:(2R)-sulfolactate sulfo-lyase subunit alpha [Rhodoblastus acidophilus]|uniref:(2R)-sulfolactate sulfo-lyase subunit alpha n=1 Tax=Rhodoblastus acidophilus TaxID=1074 RepID=A0A212S9H7_RHOAC|nr:UxaA family hydrolase [Rhodoblastus acidophilus]MCW2318701.1 (2R)-sulfolactate sulfo-lyase subunit alpha [Rhodoblastus acidophilus]PPQ36266.1 flagellar biosynthesis protein FlgA [Rhodoblastus acidophilus]RAI20412.1 flagellar biosynthesis protein FlgA [Rhodoblastus acidophilus]SNB81909.1 (2R)-sulfolactate sulfo-lyase subunit alpha [Rhodoblastus acidophilus]
MSAPDFLVHDSADNVGVVVVENAEAGRALSGWVIENDSTIQVPSIDRIPLGHKIALVDIPADATIVKYGHGIGRTVAPIARGGHVHVQNLKTRRW